MVIVMDGSAVTHRRLALSVARALSGATRWAAPRNIVRGRWIQPDDLNPEPIKRGSVGVGVPCGGRTR
jgi:hypothetical protein